MAHQPTVDPAVCYECRKVELYFAVQSVSLMTYWLKADLDDDSCFQNCDIQALAPCCLFLAAKTEEQPRKLEHVLKVAHACLHRDAPPLDLKSEV